MIFKFKNGYQVQIRDCAGKSREELIEIAKKAVKDAVSLEKRIDTNVSFMPTKMKAAIEAEDKDMFDREYRFLRRDIDADLSESHKNYPKVYRKEVLEKLIKQYEDAGKLVRKADAAFGTALADVFDKDVEQLKVNWALKEVKPFYVKIVYANGVVTTKEVASAEEGEADIQKRIKAGKKDGNAVLTAAIIENGTEAVVKEITPEDVGVKDAEEPKFRAYINHVDLGPREKRFETIEEARNELGRRIRRAKRVGEPLVEAYIMNMETGEVEQLYKNKDLLKDSKHTKDADKIDIPPYRVKITYANGEVTIKYEDDLTAAVKDIRDRIEAGKKDGNAVAVALVFDSMTDEIVLSSDRDEDIKVKDAPPPYYDPTDYPSIKSDYSVERIGREARHMDKDDPILSELDDVKAEIDELIAKGSEALIDAGWSKADARQAIANRYIALEKELRRNKLIDKARELHVKIRALEKAWDLRV